MKRNRIDPQEEHKSLEGTLEAIERYGARSNECQVEKHKGGEDAHTMSHEASEEALTMSTNCGTKSESSVLSEEMQKKERSSKFEKEKKINESMVDVKEKESSQINRSHNNVWDSIRENHDGSYNNLMNEKIMEFLDCERYRRSMHKIQNVHGSLLLTCDNSNNVNDRPQSSNFAEKSPPSALSPRRSFCSEIVQIEDANIKNIESESGNRLSSSSDFWRKISPQLSYIDSVGSVCDRSAINSRLRLSKVNRYSKHDGSVDSSQTFDKDYRESQMRGVSLDEYLNDIHVSWVRKFPEHLVSIGSSETVDEASITEGATSVSLDQYLNDEFVRDKAYTTNDNAEVGSKSKSLENNGISNYVRHKSEDGLCICEEDTLIQKQPSQHQQSRRLIRSQTIDPNHTESSCMGCMRCCQSSQTISNNDGVIERTDDVYYMEKVNSTKIGLTWK